jgi:hypothetical protein
MVRRFDIMIGQAVLIHVDLSGVCFDASQIVFPVNSDNTLLGMPANNGLKFASKGASLATVG